MRFVPLLLSAATCLAADDEPALMKSMDARAAHYGNVSRKIATASHEGL
jgi:hypothetical protein